MAVFFFFNIIKLLTVVKMQSKDKEEIAPDIIIQVHFE